MVYLPLPHLLLPLRCAVAGAIYRGPTRKMKPRDVNAFVREKGAFSAASNVTGTLEEVDRVTSILHRAGALAFWDYATAAPYVRVDMNPVASGTDDQVIVIRLNPNKRVVSYYAERRDHSNIFPLFLTVSSPPFSVFNLLSNPRQFFTLFLDSPIRAPYASTAWKQNNTIQYNTTNVGRRWCARMLFISPATSLLAVRERLECWW